MINNNEEIRSSAEDTQTPSLFPAEEIETPIAPKQEPVKQLEPNYSDDAFKDVERVNPGEVLEEMTNTPFSHIFIPSTTNRTAVKRDTEATVGDYDNLTLEETQAITLDRIGAKYNASTETISGGDGTLTVSYDTYVDKLNGPTKFTNDPTLAGKHLGMKPIDPSKYSKPGVKTDQWKLFYKIMSKTNKGDRIIVPLWHSGFKIIVNPPTPSDILSFYNKMARELSEVGANTMGLIYSNYTSLTHKYFLEMLETLIDSATINLTESDASIIDYISILDLNALYLAVMTSMTRQGLAVNVSCNNVNVIEDGKPKCDFTAKGKIDPTKILWVHDDELPEWMKKQIDTNGTGSVSVQEVKKYQEEIFKMAKNTTYTFMSKIGSDVEDEENPLLEIKLHLQIPSIAEYLSESEYWRMEISNIVKDALTSKYTPTEKEQMVSYVTYIMKMVSYNSFVKSLEVEGEELVERELLSKALATTNKDDDESINKFIRNILKFIEDASIAIVAIPSFTCPKCKADQHSHGNAAFKELIPIAMETLFFDQAARITVGKQA